MQDAALQRKKSEGAPASGGDEDEDLDRGEEAQRRAQRSRFHGSPAPLLRKKSGYAWPLPKGSSDGRRLGHGAAAGGRRRGDHRRQRRAARGR
ncbi:unnamed protein product, partial [Prorocentrum cordatum]